MSEYAVQYVAEEHAPDPVHTPGDPTTPGKIGIWLFLASEIMFFAAILGSYIIFRSGSPNLFAKNAETLNKWAAGGNTLVLIFSSLTMALAVRASQQGNPRRAAKFLAVTIGCAFVFLGVKFFEYKSKFEHYTFQVPVTPVAVAPATAPATAPGEEPAPPAPPAKAEPRLVLYDGHVHGPKDSKFPNTASEPFIFSGIRYYYPEPSKDPVKATAQPNLHLLTEADIAALASTEVTLRGLLPAGTTESPLEDAAAWALLAKGTAQSTSGTLEFPKLNVPPGVKLLRVDRASAPLQSGSLKLQMADGSAIDTALAAGASYDIIPLPDGKTPSRADLTYVKESGTVTQEKIAPGSITNWFDYGPSRNVFFSCYFTLTGIHGLHVIGGIIPLTFLLIHSLRGKVFPRHTEATGLYWHFVDLVWIFLFPLMYLI